MDENRLNKVSHLFPVRLWLDQEAANRLQQQRSKAV